MFALLKPTDDAYFMLAMKAFPFDTEIPQIAAPEVETKESLCLVAVFGCLGCEESFRFKV